VPHPCTDRTLLHLMYSIWTLG